MIKEFALDPKVISHFQQARYFLDQFGIPYGRMISRFPSAWRKHVYESIKGLPDIERLKIVELLNNASRKMMRNARSYDPTLGWLQNAEKQHSTKPFQAIISTENPNNSGQVLLAEQVTQETALWSVPTKVEIPRNANSIAATIEPLISAANQILFVDPHFDPSQQRFRLVLQSLVRCAVRNHSDCLTVEYHVRGDYHDAPTFEHFKSKCLEKLPRLLPRGISVTFVRWIEKLHGLQFHERYILTELGGVKVDPGLDEGPEGHSFLLELDEYGSVWARYRRNVSPSTYECEGEFIVVGDDRN
jgi:hypothetical protein